MDEGSPSLMSQPLVKFHGAGLAVKRRSRTPVRIRRVTVLFADLRGYTAMAERLSPASIVPLLDEFFSLLAAATAHGGGRIFHMAGDGMMAAFGVDAEASAADGARGAVAAGRDILRQFAELSTRWRAELEIETGVGVGLHLGEVAMGSLGPPGKKAVTLVGDTVNVAARLCARARAGEVLLSAAVAAATEIEAHANALVVEPFPVLQLPRFALRGRSAPLDIWCIPAIDRLAVLA